MPPVRRARQRAVGAPNPPRMQDQNPPPRDQQIDVVVDQGRNAPQRRARDRGPREDEIQLPPAQPARIAPPPPVQLSDQQLASISDQVANQIMVQMGQRNQDPNQPVPIYDVNGGNQLFESDVDDISLNDVQIQSISQDLGCNVPNKTKIKIVSNEYIDLATLLVKNIEPDGIEKQLTVRNGGIVLETKKDLSKINNIQEWTDAFLVFATIYTTAFPGSIGGILKYIHTIRLGASRTSGLGWKNYDVQFRLKKEKNPAMSWAIVDHELWLLYMHQQSTQSNPTQNVSTPSVNKCYDFNYKGHCERKSCTYLHKCLKCSYPHPVIKCRVVSGNYRSGNNHGGWSRSAASSASSFNDKNNKQASRRT